MVYKKVALILLVVLVTLGLSGQAGNAANDELARIRSDIAAQGLQWTAGETSRSRLPAELRRRGMGARLMPPTELPALFPQRSKTMAIPDQFDWRSQNGHNWITKIKSQGSCGSCWAFAVAAAMEAMFRIEQQKPDLEIDLSEQFMVSCSDAGNCEEGGYPYELLGYIRNYGAVPESCFRYRADDIPCETCAEGENNRFFVRNRNYITRETYENEYIAEQLTMTPLIVFMNSFSDFDHYNSGIYERTDGAVYITDHLVLLIGYNLAERYWICKNSWGTDWGEQGYFKIRWDQVSMGSWVLKTTGTYQLKPAQGGE